MKATLSPSALPTSLVALLVALWAPPAAIAQQPEPLRAGVDFAAIDAPVARTSTAFAAFAARNPGTWWTRWCPATGTPMEVFGTGMPLVDWRESSLGEARRHALATLRANADLLGLADDEFRESIGAAFGNVFSFTFEQFHKGLPVIGGRADVRISRIGRVASLGSQALPIPADFAVVPTLDPEAAERAAWLALGALRKLPVPGPARTARLVVFGDLQSRQLATPFLCWEVPVDALDGEGNGPVGRYYIDAHTGAVRHYANDKHQCGFAGCRRPGAHRHDLGAARRRLPATYTVLGYARDGRSTITPPTLVPLPGLEIAVPGIGTVVTDAAGQFTVDLVSPTNVTVVMDGVHHQLVSGGNAATQTATLQPGVPATIVVLTPTANADQLAHTTCSLWTHRVNEWARGILGNSPQLAGADNVLPTVNLAQTCNAFYTNNSINFFSSGGGCNNTTSSSVIAHEWGHGLDDRYGGISQVHGLSEGWGDICSEYLLDHPVVAEDFFSNGAALRTGLNTRQYPPPSEVHDAGEVFMGFAWKFRENLRTAFGTTAAVQISDTVVLGSIAANATDQPSAVNQIFLADDNDGNLTNGTPHYAQLEPACLAHNLPYPALQLATFAVPALADTTRQLTPRFVTATVTPNLGVIQQVSLVWNDGAPHQIAMIPTGAPNEYQALLPGHPTPTTVAWHVEATSSIGPTVRYPAVADNSYQVITLSRFWSEDFETGAPGWTHSATIGTDDWEIGTPLGLAGAGWTDPAAAAGGTRCAGTDLTGDGAYAPSSQTALRSPTIDCTGKFGIRLRYKRWITVDSIVRDIALLRAAGGVYWANNPVPLAPVVDGAWVQQELRLLSADNNSAVVLEWYLRTDATTGYGGWNIDDVELLTTSLPAPLPDRMQVLPAMAVQGSPMTATLHTNLPSSPFLILAGDSAGPTLIPGVPLLEVGGNLASVGGVTDGAGNQVFAFTAPNVAALTGLVWWSQTLTLDANTQIVATNPCINLFTQ